MAPKRKRKQPDDAETMPSKHQSKAPDDAESTPRKKLNHKMPVPLAGFDEMGRKLLCSLGFPVAFWKLLEILMTLVPIIPDLDFVEFFCGAKAVTFALERLGLRGLGYDKIHDRSHQNMMSGLGFCCALCWLLRVTPDDGFVWEGTLCSSWIWLSRGTTRRTRALPRGDQSSSSVVTGNALAARSAIIIAICYARGLSWVLEQPDSSLMKQHPAMACVRRCMRAHHETWWQITTFMGAFNGPSTKPHSLYSNSPIIEALRRKHPGGFSRVETAKKSRDSRGRHVVTGGKDLTDSQEYTKEFGESVAEAFVMRRFDEDLVTSMHLYESDSENDDGQDNQEGASDADSDDNVWEDAWLDDALEVAQRLSAANVDTA